MRSNSVKPPKVAWFEDHPEQVMEFGYVFGKHPTHPLSVSVLSDYEEALALVEPHHPEAVDCLLIDVQDDRNGRDGIQLYQRAFELNAVLPKIFVTGYYKLYEERLLRTAPSSRILSKGELRMETVDRVAADIRGIADEYREFCSMGFRTMTRNQYIKHERKLELARTHWRVNKEWIVHYLAAHDLAWIAVAGTGVVASGNELTSILGVEERQRLADATGVAIFVYRSPFHSEEAEHPQGLLLGHYPVLSITHDGRSFKARLDTGTNQTMLSDEIAPIPDDPSIQEGVFKGKSFEYSPVNLDLEFAGDCARNSNVVRSEKFSASIVHDWKSTSFVGIDKSRYGLIGRDFFHQTRASVTIRSEKKGSKVCTSIKESAKS